MKTGDKVVCVDDKWKAGFHPLEWGCNAVPVAGVVYCVRAFRANPAGIYLVGIVTAERAPDGSEIAFRVSRFRLLDELKAESAAKKSNAVAV